MTFEWRPTPRQEKMLQSPAKETLYGGARGGGKTDGGIIWTGIPAIHNKHKKFRGLVVRETSASLADWVDRAEEVYCATGARLTLSPTPTFTWPWGSKIYTGHLKDQRSLGKYLGREFQRITIEELTQLESEDLYLKLLASARSSIKGLRAKLLATTNPGGKGHHWVKRRFVDPIAPNTLFHERGSKLSRIFIPSTIEDNPHLMENDPEYIEILNNLPRKLREAWKNGNWDILEGSYFTEFSRTNNVCKPFVIPSTWAIYRAIDWGFYPDPAVCLWFAVSPDRTRRKIVLFRERHWIRTTPANVAKDILFISENDHQMRYTVADPSMWAGKNGVSDAERMMEAGLPIIQADNTRIPGWIRVHELLQANTKIFDSDGVLIRKAPQLKIFDTCTKTINSIAYAQHSDKDPMDVADFKLDHWLDAVRYFAMGRASAGKDKARLEGPLSLKMIKSRGTMDLRKSGVI